MLDDFASGRAFGTADVGQQHGAIQVSTSVAKGEVASITITMGWRFPHLDCKLLQHCWPELACSLRKECASNALWTGFSFDCNISDSAPQATGFNGCNPAIADKPDNGWEYGNHYAEIWPSARAAAWDAAEEGELRQTLNDIHAVHSVRPHSLGSD